MKKVLILLLMMLCFVGCREKEVDVIAGYNLPENRNAMAETNEPSGSDLSITPPITNCYALSVEYPDINMAEEAISDYFANCENACLVRIKIGDKEVKYTLRDLWPYEMIELGGDLNNGKTAFVGQ